MVLTQNIDLPTEEELTVQEVNVSSSILRSAAFHLGKYCESVNNEFMLCKLENQNDPRACLKEGKDVTSCSLEFFRKMKKACRESFEAYAECVDKSSSKFEFNVCRKTQSVFDKCMLDELNIERPHYGYFAEAKVHDSPRPKPTPPEIKQFEPTPGLPADYPRPTPKYYGKQIYQ